MPTTPLDCNSFDGTQVCTTNADCPEVCNLICVRAIAGNLCLRSEGPPTSR